jgi:predicted kinase
MSGLPSAGKTTWVEAHAADLPVVSLDKLRTQLGVRPNGDQRRVVQKAREQVRGILRRGDDFVYDATNLSLRLRWPLVQLMMEYRARVRIVYVECDRATLLKRNRARKRQVPEPIVERMLGQWKVPDLTEAHEVLYAVDGTHSAKETSWTSW